MGAEMKLALRVNEGELQATLAAFLHIESDKRSLLGASEPPDDAQSRTS
jgi:hypothetical protein